MVFFRKQKILIMFIFVSFFVGALFSGCKEDKNGNEINISNWKINYSALSSFDDLNNQDVWNDINLSGLFKVPGNSDNGYRFVWLKAEAEVENPHEYHGLSLGRIYFADRVYINGKLVGSHFVEEMKSFHYPRNYELPAGTLKKGKNEIHIYLGVYGKEFGGICGQPRLLSKELYVQQEICSALIFQQLPIGVMVFLAGMAVIILCMYIIGGIKDEKYLITLGILLVWFFHLFTIFSPYQIFNVNFRISILWTSTFLVAIFFFLGSQHYFRIYFKTLNQIYFSLLIGFCIITLVLNNSAATYYPGRILGVINLILVIAAHLFLLYTAAKKNMSRKILVYWVMAFIPGLTIGADIVNYLWVFHYPPLYHFFTIPIISILLILFHTHGHRIEDVHVERITAPVSLPQAEVTPKTVVTVQLEEKLKRIIDYLGENYRASFTREELAEREGLSPDYMSRMFKVYTGKKINDYINELRIIDTGVQLVETDRKIIDIAFSVGFVSLVTFNRAFSKVYNISPRQYRDKSGTFLFDERSDSGANT